MSNYPMGVTDDDPYFTDETEPEVEKYGLWLETYGWVFDGPKPIELTLEEIKDAQRIYSQRNPKGVYEIRSLEEEIVMSDQKIRQGNEGTDLSSGSLLSPRPAPPRFAVGDRVWFVTSGTQQHYVECPDCLGQCALTVTLGDGSQVSIDCDCCKQGYLGSRGSVISYEWKCTVESDEITGMEISGADVRYKFQYRYPDAVYATKEEAEAESVKVLAAHVEDENRRMNHVKDRQVRHRTWAFSVSYHRRCAKEARKQAEYHESKLVVAKAKTKTPDAEDSSDQDREAATATTIR